MTSEARPNGRSRRGDRFNDGDMSLWRCPTDGKRCFIDNLAANVEAVGYRTADPVAGEAEQEPNNGDTQQRARWKLAVQQPQPTDSRFSTAGPASGDGMPVTGSTTTKRTCTLQTGTGATARANPKDRNTKRAKSRQIPLILASHFAHYHASGQKLIYNHKRLQSDDAGPNITSKPTAHRILVVDDEPDVEPLVLQRMRRNIRSGQYELAFAQNGMEALEKPKADPDIDISDINMPQMDGLALLEQTPDIAPDTHAVIVSAYGDMKNI